VIAPYGYDDQNLNEHFLPPSVVHLFGTDYFGRDIFSRTVYGSRVSLTIGMVSVSISCTLGVLLGCLAGYFGSRLDNIIMRGMDILMAIPSILLAVAVVASLGIGYQNIILAISISPIPQYARLVRGTVMAMKNRDFVTAAYSDGAGDRWIIYRHILPNCLAPIIVQATTNIAIAILTVSSLSFIGLGIVPPTPEWGSMLAAGRAYFRDYWFVVTFPGLAIMLSVLAFNLFGDGLRDAMDPKMK
jgi:peptide/nickel transport system permease protein